jgi:hypothetical protein
MNDPHFIYLLDLVFLCIIIVSFIVINYQIHIQDKIKNKEQIKNSLFDMITCTFIAFFLITILIFGSKYGLKKAFIIWCILNIITPVPETGLMVSLPLNKYYDINLILSQIIITIVSVFTIFFTYNQKYYNSFELGKYFVKLLNNKRLLILLSIISTFIGLIIIQKELDFYYKQKEFTHLLPLLLSYTIIVILYLNLFFNMK